MGDSPDRSCPLCGGVTPEEALHEAGFADPVAVRRLQAEHPQWRRADGACPACVQEALLRVLLEKGDAALHAGVQQSWPLDAEAAFGALPTPLRLHADPRFTGRGVTLAVVDAAFFPHRDLVRPRNRIRAWADASRDPVPTLRFPTDEVPAWPGWDVRGGPQWHGLMTTAAAAGNGHASHGLYRGLASEADLVLVQVQDDAGRITNASIARALRFVLDARAELGIRVVNLSLGGEAVTPLRGNPVDQAVADLEAAGITVVVAAGNDGARSLVPPGTSPAAITVGGLDDKNTLDHAARSLWHSNYGQTALGEAKPELVAPSLWVVAPVLPGTATAFEARELFARRARQDAAAEVRIAAAKLVTPHYQHVEGTSFAAPLAASVVACMLEAAPGLRPSDVRRILLETAQPVPGVSRERQGRGALDAGRAVGVAVEQAHGVHVS